MTTLRRGELSAVEESDQVIVNTGYGPDHSIYRELQIHESYVTRGPLPLATAVGEATSLDGLAAAASDADTLSNPEPNFYILGHKSYGRSPRFLLEAGYRQAAAVVARLASGLGAAVTR
jgi:hypothetical protein